MVPRQKNNAYAKFEGDKQTVLWYFLKWPNEDVIFTAMNMYKYKGLRLCKRWPCSTCISTELTMKG